MAKLKASPEGWVRLGRAVESQRIARQWTIRQAAKYARISPTTWGHIETAQSVDGGRHPLTLNAVATALDEDFEWVTTLLLGDDADAIRSAQVATLQEITRRLSAIEGRLDRLEHLDNRGGARSP